MIVEGIELSPERAKFGLTKMFFKAGVIGDLEDARDEKIASILTTLQDRVSLRTRTSLKWTSYSRVIGPKLWYVNPSLRHL